MSRDQPTVVLRLYRVTAGETNIDPYRRCDPGSAPRHASQRGSRPDCADVVRGRSASVRGGESNLCAMTLDLDTFAAAFEKPTTLVLRSRKGSTLLRNKYVPRHRPSSRSTPFFASDSANRHSATRSGNGVDDGLPSTPSACNGAAI